MKISNTKRLVEYVEDLGMDLMFTKSLKCQLKMFLRDKIGDIKHELGICIIWEQTTLKTF